jgi:hypothetical protein
MVDGTLIASQPFANTDFYTNGALTKFSDASLVSYNSFVSSALTGDSGSAFYDNYLVTESSVSVIPEPSLAGVSAMIFGSIGMFRRVRRRSGVAGHSPSDAFILGESSRHTSV